MNKSDSAGPVTRITIEVAALCIAASLIFIMFFRWWAFLALKGIAAWLVIVIGSAGATIVGGLVAGKEFSFDHLVSHYTANWVFLVAILPLFVFLVWYGDQLNRRYQAKPI